MNGLVATRECLDKGLRPTCFEREDGLGGLWRFTEHESHSSVYRSTHINSPKDWNTFADFPHEEGTPRSMPRDHVARYIKRYVEEKGLKPHIQLSTAVRSIAPNTRDATTGKWSWTVAVERAEGAVVTEHFDAVLICTGHHSKPNVPDFPGADQFTGEMLHSHAYKDNSRFAGKRVVTVGACAVQPIWHTHIHI
jgi:dimethylaniline monooxygenase (N-oxide forming)